MSLVSNVQKLYKQTIGGTAPGGVSSSTGDISQMVKYLIANPGGSPQYPFRKGVPTLELMPATVAPNSVTTWPAANDAIFVPFELDVTLTIAQIHLVIATSSGNIDVGIYPGAGGAKLVTMGTTAMAAAGLQTFNIADTSLPKGRYLLAVAVDNATAVIDGYIGTRLFPSNIVGGFTAHGVKKQATAFPLPASATLASPTAAFMPNAILEFT